MAQHWRRADPVRKPGTYRIVTIAIGILVAMVIAFTLWVHTPEHQLPSSTPTATQSILQFPVSTLDLPTFNPAKYLRERY